MTDAYEVSSGNVFADLGFKDSEQAVKLLGATQSEVSALMRCKPVSVSVGRLNEFLAVLGGDMARDRPWEGRFQ